MVSNLKISIIVPVYNTEAYLEECLDSILAQTLKDIEIICVNDGSPDHSQDILERYAQKDRRIKVLVKENGGLSSARNAGMKLAKGEYIAFVDSDDFIAPNMMEALYDCAEERGADIIIGDLYLYDDRTHTITGYRDPRLFHRLKDRVVTLEEAPELIRCIAAWDRLYRRDFLQKYKVEFPEGLVYEDALFTVATLVKAQRVSVVPQKLYYYRKNVPGSITEEERKNDQYKKDFLEIQARIRNILNEEQISKEIFCEYLVYFMNNAFVHQGNASSFAFFKVFFCSIRSLMQEWEYPVVRKLCDSKRARYAAYLQKNCIVQSWCYFLIRRQARKAKLWVKSQFSIRHVKK